MIVRENVSVQLKITSATLTPTEIEKRLGIKPDESWKTGDRTGVFGAIEKANCYTLISTPIPTASLEDHVQSILRRVAPVATKIGEFASQATIKLVCAVQRKSIPPIILGRDDIRWLGVMGAQLDVEVTVVPDKEREALRNAPPASAQKPPTTGF